jgi:hypothetical protein
MIVRSKVMYGQVYFELHNLRQVGQAFERIRCFIMQQHPVICNLDYP